jgi:hypothetical protein
MRFIRRLMVRQHLQGHFQGHFVLFPCNVSIVLFPCNVLIYPRISRLLTITDRWLSGRP